jgi:hypothetical protein
VTGGSSYLSSHDKRVVFGLGSIPAHQTMDLEILWPNGKRQTATALETNRYHQIMEQ